MKIILHFQLYNWEIIRSFYDKYEAECELHVCKEEKEKMKSQQFFNNSNNK